MKKTTLKTLTKNSVQITQDIQNRRINQNFWTYKNKRNFQAKEKLWKKIYFSKTFYKVLQNKLPCYFKKRLQKHFFKFFFQQAFSKKKLWTPQWHSQFRLFYGQKNKIKHVRNVYQKQKNLRLLRTTFRTEFNPIKHWKNWKEKQTFLQKQKDKQWLQSSYYKYKSLRTKDRIDFLQTCVGKMMLLADIHNIRYSQRCPSWWPLRRFWERMIQKQEKEILKRYSYVWGKVTHLSQQYFNLMQIYRRSWWYETLNQKKGKIKSLKKFHLYRPDTAFQSFWKERHSEPWKDALLFRRFVSEGYEERLTKKNRFQTRNVKPYLRLKNPRSEKKNHLYKKIVKLFNNQWKKSYTEIRHAARMKQLARKFIQPFYGNLSLKQTKKLIKKAKKIKSSRVSQTELILSHLESRLDVVIYRLNLAPNILWARRLILEGAIFVTNLKKIRLWELMHSSLKKLAFPLKLRDPKNLYAQTLWQPNRRVAKYKFIWCPQKNISYLVKSNDLIQCGKGIFLHHFKHNPLLLKRSIPTHLLTGHKTKPFWHWHFQKYEEVLFNRWEQSSEHIQSAVFLFTPQFEDLDSKDRMTNFFFRWAFF